MYWSQQVSTLPIRGSCEDTQYDRKFNVKNTFKPKNAESWIRSQDPRVKRHALTTRPTLPTKHQVYTIVKYTSKRQYFLQENLARELTRKCCAIIYELPDTYHSSGERWPFNILALVANILYPQSTMVNGVKRQFEFLDIFHQENFGCPQWWTVSKETILKFGMGIGICIWNRKYRWMVSKETIL